MVMVACNIHDTENTTLETASLVNSGGYACLPLSLTGLFDGKVGSCCALARATAFTIFTQLRQRLP